MADSDTGPATGTGSSDGGSSEESSGSTGGGVVDEGCPECLVLATGLQSGRGIAVDATHVFFGDEAAGTIHSITKGGGDGGVLADEAGTPYELLVHEGFLYWTSNTDAGDVWRIPVDGGRRELIADATNPRTVAVADGFIYWGSYDGSTGDISRVDIDLQGESEQVSTFLGGGVSDLVAAGGVLYASVQTQDEGAAFIQPPPKGPPIGAVYAINPDNPFDPNVVAADMAQPWGLALSGSTLVWANGDGAVENVPNSVLAGSVGAPASTLAANQTAPWGIAADDNFAYWTDADTVKAIPLAGGMPTLLADQQNLARYIAVDDTSVYWITSERVLQRPKP